MDLGSLYELAPAVNFASRSQAQAGSIWGPRTIPDYQLFYVITGKALVKIGSREYTISSGECAYYGPGAPHQLVMLEHTAFYSLHYVWNSSSSLPVHPAHNIVERNLAALALAGKIEPDFVELPPFAPVSLPAVINLPGLEPYFVRMVKAYEGELPGHGLLLRGLLSEMLVHVVQGLAGLDRPLAQHPRIGAALYAMQERPELNWTVSELAGLCGYHPVHFAKLFKEEVGLLPKQYVIQQRMKLAKTSLLRGEKTAGIAERLGFASVHHFSRQFKQFTGLTPLQFRMYGRE
ncbi:AraC family transcriptional regulator [Paenibacillus gansuensis]|uniref:Helix-turn-helix domain-containing protein n=1 Tax=Paenibacillus gansuensis TaxID=306542 RepID=A0ABW5P905_9BACL